MKKIIMVAGAILAFVLPLLGQSGPPPLRLVQTIPLSVDGRMDHLYADVKGMRLFVAALANNTVEVIDLRAGKVIKSIAGPQKPQGVWYVSPLNKLFVASGNDGMCRVYDGKTLDLIESIKLDLGPDLVGYNPRSKLFYVGYGGEDAKKDYGNVAIVDARKNKHIGDIRTKAHPGGILVDVDAAHGRLFVGARNPARVIVYDINSFQRVADFPAVGLMDGMFFDGKRKRLYVSGGEGFVDVFQQQDGDHYAPLARIPTRPIARTSLFVPELNRYYVALPRKDNESAEIRVYEPQ